MSVQNDMLDRLHNSGFYYGYLVIGCWHIQVVANNCL
jgi:hypothetical protein